MMSSNGGNDDRISVVAVCGKEARVYGPFEHAIERRPLRAVHVFNHNGAAKEFAADYEAKQRGSAVSHG
jgi:hypothetical protein